MTEARASAPARAGRWPGGRAAAVFLVRRVPFTSAVVMLMLVLAVATGALWHGIEGLPVFRWVGFGLPAFDAGRWYTLAFGAFFALVPVYYLLVAGGFAVLVGFAEYRLGTGRTVLVTVGGHVVGILGAAAVLAIGKDLSWPWADRIGAMTDVGFSAGMLAAACVASVTVAPPWGLRIRLSAAGYAGLSLLYIGLMADLEHSIAVLFGWALARLLAGPRAVPQGGPSDAEWRILGAAGLIVLPLLQFTVRLFPGDGPTGTAEHQSVVPPIWHGVVLVFALVAALGWYRGRAWALPVGLAIAAVDVLIGVAVAAISSDVPQWLRQDLPTAYADAVTGVALGVLLLLGRHALLGSSRPGGATADAAGSAR